MLSSDYSVLAPMNRPKSVRVVMLSRFLVAFYFVVTFV